MFILKAVHSMSGLWDAAVSTGGDWRCSHDHRYQWRTGGADAGSGAAAKNARKERRGGKRRGGKQMGCSLQTMGRRLMAKSLHRW